MEQLVNEFDVPLPIDQAWAVITDIERIAPCMPGAQLEEIEGNEFRGGVKVKVGPITASFKGKALFQERDDVNNKAVIKAEGRDTGGKGNASAIITATATSNGPDSTHMTVATDLNITGKVAQFGRGAMNDISNKILGQFVACLEAKITAEKASPGAGDLAAPAIGASTASPASADPQPAGDAKPAAATDGVRKVQMTATKPVDLLDAAGAPIMKRLAPVLGALFFIFVIFSRRKRKG